MKVVPTALPEVVRIEPDVFRDARGGFVESFAARRYAEAGLRVDFVQDNVSTSRRNALRGLHLQHPHDQAKLVHVVEGEILDIAVDVRVGSPRFGRWVGATLSGDNCHQLFIPEGFAHGFCVLSERAVVSYKCSDYYVPGCELAIRWNDPELAIDWPIEDPSLSDKDGRAPVLAAIERARLPRYVAGTHGA